MYSMLIYIYPMLIYIPSVQLSVLVAFGSEIVFEIQIPVNRVDIYI